jgi:hypothetical protein
MLNLSACSPELASPCGLCGNLEWGLAAPGSSSRRIGRASGPLRKPFPIGVALGEGNSQYRTNQQSLVTVTWL